jgi:hypothetical protein
VKTGGLDRQALLEQLTPIRDLYGTLDQLQVRQIV